MAFSAQFQQLSLSRNDQPPQPVRARPVMIVPGSSNQDRTYINVTPVAVTSKRHGDVQLASASKTPITRGQQAPPPVQNKPQMPAIPRSQEVKRFSEPLYSTLLQLQNDRQRPAASGSVAQQKNESPNLRGPAGAVYANLNRGEYVYAEGFRSSDSQSSATEEELLAAASSSQSGTFYQSPPSPVSSSYSELRQATRGPNGLHPLGGYLYQMPQSVGQANYEAIYEPVMTPGTQPPPLLSRHALIQHQQKLSEYFGKCSKCHGKIVGEGSGCSAMGKLYHIHCFRCTGCQCLLQGKPFYALDGKPYCESDYINTLEKCCKCNQPITDRILRATGKPYHPQCFSCVVCSQTLDGVPFTVDATNQIHCIEDFHRRFAPKCSVCKQPIMPEPGVEETVRVVALDRSFHIKCYKCEECGLLLSSGGEGQGCYPLDDRVLCRQCNTRLIQQLTEDI